MRSAEDQECQAQVRKLLDSCLRGDLSVVEKLIGNELLSVNANDDDDVTPLQAAAAAGHVALVEYLLKNGADVELCNQTGLTPLLHSAYYGHIEVFRLLIQHGANPHTYSYLGSTALTLAARGGHLQLLKTLLSFGLQVNPCASGNDLELTPLMAAVLNNQEASCRFLISRGADVQASIRSNGFTPLMLAAMYSNASTVQILLDGGADPNAVNLQGKTALDLATKSARREIQSILEPRTSTKKCAAPVDPPLNIIDAVKQGKTTRLREILELEPSQANLISPDEGSCALIYAAMIGRLDYVALLVKYGAHLDQRDKFGGWTALMQAVFYGKTTIAKYLINAGADVNVKSFAGYTAFDLATAVEDADKELLTLLANKSVDDEENHRNNTMSFGRSALSKMFKHRKRNARHTSLWKKVASRLRLIRLRPNQDSDQQRPKTPFALSWGPENNIFIDPIKSMSSADMFFTCNDILSSKHSLANNQINPSDNSATQTDSTRRFALGITALLYPGSIPIIPPLHRPSELSDSVGLAEQLNEEQNAQNQPETNEIRSTCVAATNAQLMGPGKPKKLRPPPPKSKRLKSQSTGLNRARRPSPLTLGFGPLGINPYPSLLRNKNNDRNNRLVRPSSYHDVQTDSSRKIVYSALGTLPRRSRPMAAKTRGNRPHSYHDPVSPTAKFASSELPLTPTRKSFAFFSGTHSTQSLNRFSSPPLSQSPSQSLSTSRRASNLSSALPVNKTDLPDMAEEEIQTILKELSLDEYYSVFEEQEVDMETFLTLTDSDLRELGIEDSKSRNEILSAARKYNRLMSARFKGAAEMHSAKFM